MKIISNYKDYYDYLQGVWGVDEKIVYKREPIYNDYPKGLYSFHIVGKWYMGYFDGQKWIYDFEELYEFNRGKRLVAQGDDTLHNYLFNFSPFGFKNELITDFPKSDKNEKYKMPVLLYKYDCLSVFSSHTTSSRYPLLQNTFIPKILPPEQIFIQISNFIAPKDLDIQNSPTDLNRFEGKGFDKKTSFRK
ncbi:MAG: hypothetical protein MUC49_02225 [Raineya sp.]|jgi:hypothetical protein|nr:hypothetical protein [Raineya sp.]